MRGVVRKMTMPAILSLLVGMVLGQRFNFLILVPSILLILLIAIGAAIARVEGPGNVALTAAAAIACLEIGYLLGISIRYLFMTAPAPANRSHTTQLTRPAPWLTSMIFSHERIGVKFQGPYQVGSSGDKPATATPRI